MFGVLIHLGVLECCVLFSGHCEFDLKPWPKCKKRMSTRGHIVF